MIFSRILTIGPSFAINAQATAQITADASVSVDLAYKGTGARLYFPDDNGSSTWGNFAPSDSSAYNNHLYHDKLVTRMKCSHSAFC